MYVLCVWVLCVSLCISVCVYCMQLCVSVWCVCLCLYGVCGVCVCGVCGVCVHVFAYVYMELCMVCPMFLVQHYWEVMKPLGCQVIGDIPQRGLINPRPLLSLPGHDMSVVCDV